MHIRQLEISGFKSYKDASLVEEFSPKSNCIVGRNGSGKSNSFRALMFVLGEKTFSQLGHKERSELLHEGAGASVMSAHVEVVFDNTERRFPLDSDEVRLRRTTGLKKDEYFLNHKHVTKSDVVNLLESAGFSRSNPYYIVQQGKVNALCLMKDEQRLGLLKEVAGTTVYEERRRNSESILADTKNKRNKIQDVVNYIEERLDELKDEKEELEAFRSLDRRKRALQYTLHDMELQNATQQLEILEQEREKEAERTAESSQRLAAVREEAETAETEVRALEKQLRRAEQESKLTEEECAALVKNKSACELKYKDMVERERLLRDQAQLHEEELERLNGHINETEGELELTARPQLSEAEGELHNAEAHLRNLNRRIFELESKQGRKNQFSTQADRDQWLHNELRSVDAAVSEKSRGLEQLRHALSERQHAQSDLEARVQELRSNLHEREAMAKAADDDIRNLMREQEMAAEERRQVWLKRQRAMGQVQAEQERLHAAEANLRRSMPPAVADGIAAVERISADLGLIKGKHVFGPLYELIEPVSDAFETAIEVSAGTSLTHVVVDNDETAARLMEELQRRRAGRVTFKPLAQIKELRRTQGRNKGNTDDLDHDIIGYQESPDQEAIPLVSRVRYPIEVKEAVRAVLGKVLLCRTASIAAAQRKALRVNCVTLEGEEVNRRGALTGGFYDSKNSKLRAVAMVRAARKHVEELEREAGTNESDATLDAADQRYNHLSSQIVDMQNDQQNSRSIAGQLRGDLHQREAQLRSAQETIKSIESSITRSEQGLKDLQAQRHTFEMELATPMEARLSPQEQQELAHARHAAATSAQEQVSAAKDQVTRAQTTISRLEAELEQNLKKRREELLVAMGQARGPNFDDPSQDPTMAYTEGSAYGTQQHGRNQGWGGDSMDVDQGGMATGETAKEAPSQSHQLHQMDYVLRQQQIFKDDLDRAEHRLSQAREQHAELEKETSKIRTRVRDLRNNLEGLKQQELELTEQLRSAEELIEKVVTKSRVQMDKREENTRKIRDLGSLSSEELNNLGEFRSTKELMNEIKNVNQELQKYSHVNKKALDQFISFSDRREMLLKRKEELDRGEQSIMELVEHLDRQKDEDIMRTFRGVAKHFREVFTELVPTGKGELVMVTRNSAAEEKERRKQARIAAKEQGAEMDDGDLSDDEGGDETKIDSVDEFIGISPRVAFTPGGQQFHMRQLSGGQRALVALTLIFAIQRCDPAPFYLFDEIDQALDQNHRASVAAMIRRQAETAQFIVTTFRPELVRVTDKCFGIQFQNKVSSIVPLEREDALDFVESIAASETGATGTHDTGIIGTPVPKRKSRGSQGSSNGDDEDDDDDEPSARSSGSGKRVRA
mmetsp:Transcript_932/g.2174  ORF Transcript_932/g.2174 Transcript_932/m.2174 type:complete len:1364 (+) Transcript_932:353-4444(+)